MQPAPIPENEESRLVSLHNLGLLDTPAEERFDLITRAATRIFRVPISTLTLVDSKREWFKSCQGLPQPEGDRAISFCGHALLSAAVLVVPDTKQDDRFVDNPMVTGEPYLRFYAGVPVMSADGQRVGVFCVKDTKPREFSKDDEEVLKGLAAWAEVEINSHNLSLALKERRKTQAELSAQTQELENAKIAARNVLEDLSIEKSKVELAKAKEEAILMSIGDGLLATDEKGSIILINKTAEKLLGKKSEEVIGKSFFEVITVEDERGAPISLEKRPVSMALAGTTTTTTTTTTTVGPAYYYVRKDKTKFPVAIVVTPIMLGGKVIGTIEVFRDIAREKEIDRAKSEFVSLASHQLRTPTAAIKWYTELLLAGKPNKDAATKKVYAQAIYDANQRMIGLITSLLNVSRIELGHLAVAPAPMDLVKLSHKVAKDLEPLAHQKQVSIRWEGERNLPQIIADQNLISIVVQNLISNALKYSTKGGTVVLRFGARKASVSVEVEDWGVGVPKGDQAKVGDKLFRARNAAAQHVEGAGLGLYLTKAILQMIGGSLSFQSEEQRGTTFRVILPLTGVAKNEGVLLS